MTEPKESPYMTIAEVAARLRISRTTAYVVAREVGVLRIGQRVMVHSDALLAWEKANTAAPKVTRLPVAPYVSRPPAPYVQRSSIPLTLTQPRRRKAVAPTGKA